MGRTDDKAAEEKSRLAEKVMSEDCGILRGLAEHDRGLRNDESEFERQMKFARRVMREKREALSMLAKYDAGEWQPD
jgi:hypothetical protein